MLIAILWRPEGGGHIENRLPVLDGGYPTGALKLLPSRSTSTS